MRPTPSQWAEYVAYEEGIRGIHPNLLDQAADRSWITAPSWGTAPSGAEGWSNSARAEESVLGCCRLGGLGALARRNSCRFDNASFPERHPSKRSALAASFGDLQHFKLPVSGGLHQQCAGSPQNTSSLRLAGFRRLGADLACQRRLGRFSQRLQRRAHARRGCCRA
jgi:hypothetical protein